MQVQRMLQRKPPLTVMERQEIFSESIQQQQRSHQGPISMAEGKSVCVSRATENDG